MKFENIKWLNLAIVIAIAVHLIRLDYPNEMNVWVLLKEWFVWVPPLTLNFFAFVVLHYEPSIEGKN